MTQPHNLVHTYHVTQEGVDLPDLREKVEGVIEVEDGMLSLDVTSVRPRQSPPRGEWVRTFCHFPDQLWVRASEIVAIEMLDRGEPEGPFGRPRHVINAMLKFPIPVTGREPTDVVEIASFDAREDAWEYLGTFLEAYGMPYVDRYSDLFSEYVPPERQGRYFSSSQ